MRLYHNRLNINQVRQLSFKVIAEFVNTNEIRSVHAMVNILMCIYQNKYVWKICLVHNIIYFTGELFTVCIFQFFCVFTFFLWVIQPVDLLRGSPLGLQPRFPIDIPFLWYCRCSTLSKNWQPDGDLLLYFERLLVFVKGKIDTSILRLYAHFILKYRISLTIL